MDTCPLENHIFSLVDCFEVAVQESLMDDFPEIVLNNYKMLDKDLLETG